MSRPKGEGHRRATRRQRDAKATNRPVGHDSSQPAITDSGLAWWESPADPATDLPEAEALRRLAQKRLPPETLPPETRRRDVEVKLVGNMRRWEEPPADPADPAPGLDPEARHEVAAIARETAAWIEEPESALLRGREVVLGDGRGYSAEEVLEMERRGIVTRRPSPLPMDGISAPPAHWVASARDDGGGRFRTSLTPGQKGYVHAYDGLSNPIGIGHEGYPERRGPIDATRTGDEHIVTEGGPGVELTKPIAALDVHLDLLRWVSGEAAKDQRREWWAAYYSPFDDVAGDGESRKGKAWDRLLGEAAGQFRLEEIAMLNRALTFYVTPEMAELAYTLAEAEEVEPLRSTDPWCPAGFVVLPGRGLRYWAPERGGSTIFARYLAWEWADVGRFTDGDPRHTTAGQGVRLWAYADADECIRGWELDDIDRAELVATHGRVVLLDMLGWACDAEWEATPGDAGSVSPEGVVGAAVHVARYRRFIKALWRLLDEQVAQATIERDGPTSRRARRAGRTPNDGDVVRVLRLRRIGVHPDGRKMSTDEMAQRFTHRWRVRAHWRHLPRGQAVLEGDQLLLDHEHRWTPDVLLRLTDSTGRRERVKIATVDPDEATAALAWAPRLVAGMVTVERLAHVREHTSGASDGWLVERYDVVSVER